MKHIAKISLFLSILLFPCMLLANSNLIGKLTKSPIILGIYSSQIETYSVFHTNYVAISQLKAAGLNVEYTSSKQPLIITAPKNESSVLNSFSAELVGQPYSIYQGEVFVGHLKTNALSSNGKILIPIGALNELYNSNLTDDFYILTPKEEVPVSASQTAVTNFSAETLKVSVTDLYWHNGIIKKELFFTLQANESLSRTASSDKTYLTSIVSSAVGETTTYKNESLCGQTNEELFRLLDSSKTLPEDIGDPIDLSTLQWAYDTINAQKLTSSTKYLVWTNLERQKTFVLINENGKWKIIKHFICSSGKSSTPTPKGTFKLTRKVPSFGQAKGYCCKNAFGFIGTSYLYHSIIFDKTGTYLLEGKGVLGKKASDGCIRLSPENSKWFYDHLISGTTVWIN